MATLSIITESNKASISSLYLILLSDNCRPLFSLWPSGYAQQRRLLGININSYLFLALRYGALMRVVNAAFWADVPGRRLLLLDLLMNYNCTSSLLKSLVHEAVPSINISTSGFSKG